LVALDAARTCLAGLPLNRFTRSRVLIVRAWFWLAAEPDTIEEKRRRLNAILDSGLENEHASLVLLLLHQKRPGS
jgi:hypothetical protein